VAWLAAAAPCAAQQPPAASAAAPASAPTARVELAGASARTNYLSDKIKFSFAFALKRFDLTKAPPTSGDACAPAFTTFKGIGTIRVDNRDVPAFVVTSVPDEAEIAKNEKAHRVRCTVANQVVAMDDIVVIEQGQIAGTPPDRYGLTFGTMLVPYKYQIKGDKSFASKATVGGYLGFRQDKSGRTGLALQYVGFVGAATVPVAQTVDGKAITQQLAGVSYGVGMLGTVKGTFEMGMVIGADRVSKSANYVNNGKPWLAVSLGFAFSN
jgi:hypothetical protein